MADGTLIILIAGSCIALALFWFILLIGDAWRLRRLRKKYNSYDDLSKQGEQKRRTGGSEFGDGRPEVKFIRRNERTSEDANGELIAPRFSELEGRQLLPTTTPLPVGEHSTSNVTTSPSSRNFFDRLHRK